MGELERQMLDLILDKVIQSELDLLFDKAKACRAIKNLENMGLTRREKKGRTYVVRWSK